MKKRKKLLYFSDIDLSWKTVGVFYKIYDHMRLFEKFFEVDLLALENQDPIVINSQALFKRIENISHCSPVGLRRKWDSIFKITKKLEAIIDDYDVIYVRLPVLIPKLLRIFQNTKSYKILEIINPVDNIKREYIRNLKLKKNFKSLLLLVSFVGLFKKFIQNFESLICIPKCNMDLHTPSNALVLEVENGIDVERIGFSRKIPAFDNEFVMVTVTSISRGQRLDKMIRSIKKYQTDFTDIHLKFRIIGDGEFRKNLEKLVKEQGLTDHVSFEGVITGKDLDKIFDEVHMGVGFLGANKGSMKVREYCSRGIPFISPDGDGDFSDKPPFVFFIDANKEIIEIDKVIDFYKNFRKEYPDYRPMIREFARERLTWSAKYNPIIRDLERRGYIEKVSSSNSNEK